MTMDEMVDALASGQKVRRPSWPEGHYVEAEGSGTDRKVAQSTMEYHGDETVLWMLLPTYNEDFCSEDFELLT